LTTILFHFFLFFLISFFNGVIFLILFNNDKSVNNVFEISLIGIVVTSLFAQLLNFFIPLNDYVIYFNLLLILIFFVLNKKLVKIKVEINYLIIVPVFLLIILNIYGSKFSDDLNHYHYSYILNTDNSNYFIGLINFHHAYGTSPLWLIAHSYFNFDHSRLQDIHILNGLILFLILGLFLKEIFDSLKKKDVNIYIPTIFLILIFILIKYSRLKEFGIDRPAFLLLYFLIYYYIKNFFIKKNQYNNNNIYILTILCFSIIFTKIIFIFIFILPLYFLLIDKQQSLLLNKKIILIGIIGISYLVKNFLISGCIIYPVEFLCFESVSWSSNLAVNWENQTGGLINRSWSSYKGGLSEYEYIKNFNWFKTWISRNFIELLEFFITACLALFITLLSFNFREKLKPKYKENFSSYKVKEITTLLSIMLFLCLIIFFLKAPVIRMFHHIFILVSIIILISLVKKKKIKVKTNFIVLFLALAFLFNGSKNLIRIKDNNYINDPWKQIYSEGLDRVSHKKKINDLIFYSGWMGPSPTGYSDLKGYNHKKIFFFNMIYKDK